MIPEGKFPERVKILDTTLRDGEQTPGVSLTPEKKITIARKLDELGVDIIEAGSPITSEGEMEAVKRIANEGLNAEISVFVRALKVDIDAALSCDVDAVHLVVPTSHDHIKYKLRKTEEEVLELAKNATEYAKEHGLTVQFSSEDATRTDRQFLLKFFKTGKESGADRCVICDTVGVMTPEKIFDLFTYMISEIKVPFEAHCHNDFGLGVANTVAALKGGAEIAHLTVNGIGERAGNASLEETVMVLKVLYNVDVRIKTEMLYEVSSLVKRLTGVLTAPNKPIVGDNAFTHESGIHTHGILAKASTYEPITPEMVGHRRKLVVGKHAGTAGLRKVIEDLGFRISDDELRQIFSIVKNIGDKGKRILDADLIAIVESVIGGMKEPPIKLDELSIMTGSRTTPTAVVRMNVEGKEVVSADVGVGPVDAAVNAIKKATEQIIAIKLEDYRVEAITGGTDALVHVVVTVSSGEHSITASGTSEDIIKASVEAMISAINRLLVLKKERGK